jgi:hypothetical protein
MNRAQIHSRWRMASTSIQNEKPVISKAKGEPQRKSGDHNLVKREPSMPCKVVIVICGGNRKGAGDAT